MGSEMEKRKNNININNNNKTETLCKEREKMSESGDELRAMM